MANERSLLILVAGPYRSNTGDDPEKIANNLRVMNEVSVELFRAGHMPITGEAIALPLIETAGSKRIGDEIFDEFFHPIGYRLIEHRLALYGCDEPQAGRDAGTALQGCGRGVLRFGRSCVRF